MSDSLREALDKLADKAEQPEESGGMPPGEWMNGFDDGKAAVAMAIRALLAAHPDETTTEWGRGWEFEGVRGVEPRNKSKRSALNQIALLGGHLVSRQVTPWKVAS